MSDFLSKLSKILIPEEEVEVVETPAEKDKEKTIKTRVRVASEGKKVVNGAPLYTEAAPVKPVQKEEGRPNLKVYEHANIKILVFEPTNFNDTRFVADALKDGKTVLINFEKIESSEQVRICDFMNGACYVLDGSVKQITNKMVLYVPKGIAIEKIEANKA